MSTSFSQAYNPQVAASATQVASQFIGVAIVDYILKQFPRRKVESGDAYADDARQLLRINLELIEARDQENIRGLLETVSDNREEIENGSGSLRQRIIRARKYKSRSKELYIVVKRASRRGIDDSLLSQMRRAGGRTGSGRPDDPFRDPPSDSSPASPPVPLPVPPLTSSSLSPSLAPSFTHNPVDSLDVVELTTYEATATGNMPVGLTLHNQDGSTEELLAQVQPGTAANDVQTITITPLGAGQHCTDDVDGLETDPTS